MAQSGNSANPNMQAVAIHANAPAERLFVTQYRCWIAGFSIGETFCWDLAWTALLRFVAPDVAKALYNEFHFFAFTLIVQANRSIEWRPNFCRCLCRDEYLALRLVEASQRRDFKEEISAATSLLGADQVQLLIMASRSLAQALKDRRLVLAPIEDSRSIAPPPHPSDRRTLH